MNAASITTSEFARVRDLVYDLTGISMGEAKRTLVVSRLGKRLSHYSCGNFDEYLDIVSAPGSEDELQTFVNLLTTNETSFFREPKHFEFLTTVALPALAQNAEVRVWSAACSTGEEPYTLAMVLSEARAKSKWEIVATDVSTRALGRAVRGHYSAERGHGIPSEYLHKYCLKGVGRQAGTFLFDRSVRSRISFHHMNLIEPLPDLGRFDIIFLRNVLIYFDVPTKAKVVSRVLSLLKPGGYFMPGHCETLHGVTDEVEAVRPAIYRKTR